MLISKNTKIKGLIILFLVALVPLIYNVIPKISTENIINSVEKDETSLKLSLPTPDYDWWNQSWTFRVPVEIKAIGNQQDAPVELYINFTKYFQNLNVQNPMLNTSTIRVIEYLSSSNFYEVDCQFDLYPRSYKNQTNAIGDLIWILNGTTLHDQTRDFFIYFNNGSSSEIPEPNYDKIRLWHEGFEEYQAGDILRPIDGQDREPTLWEISNSTSARGTSSLNIWGNCWKVSYTGPININSNTRVTAKIRLDDPSIQREISGLGFHTTYTNIPASSNGYNIRGSQSWGSAGSYKFRNQYYATNTFFWYTFEVDSEISLDSFSYIFYIGDDDDTNWLNLYWDDISIWAKPVQTTPNNSLQTTFGDVQPIAYTLKVTCKDEDGNPVPNTHIYLTNDLNPSYNQDNITDEDGEWIFINIEKEGLYNVTVNYTQKGLISPKTATVFYYEDYSITQLNNRITAFLNLSKYNFNVTDKDNDPIQYGFVLLKDGADTVGKTVLSDSGTGSITWVNNTAYNYEVYYDYDSIPDNSKYRYSNLTIYSAAVVLKDIDVSTEISKITFNVTDTEMVPFTNAKLRFYNQTDFNNESEIIANVSVDINGIARFVSFSNSYGNWGNYTVDIYFGGLLQSFIANGSGISPPDGFEFTLVFEDYVKIEIDLNKDEWNSTINIINYPLNVFWGDSISINFNFSAHDPYTHTIPTLVTPNELYIQIFEEELTPFSGEIDILSSEISTGVFNYTFNTTAFNLIGGTSYYFKIIGNYKSYVFNDIGYNIINIQAIPTDIKYYNYSLDELTDKRISVIYQESVNISVDYFDENTEISLNGALLTYSWDYGSGTLSNDPLHADLYYFEFDSSSAPTAAEYIIDITAVLTNFSSIIDSIIVKILPRPTTINGLRTLFQISPKIYIFNTTYYIFEYKDIIHGVVIGNLDVSSYNWYRLDEDGNPLSGPGNEGTGDLVSITNDRYLLDFDTELRELGEYSIFITMQKENYEVRNAFISLTISKRPIFMDFKANGLPGYRIGIVQGKTINFSIVLSDPSNGSQLLGGANLTLKIDGIEFRLNEVDTGVYENIFSTNNINAFFTPVTLTGKINIELENYEIDPETTTTFTIIVGMTEIFPGVPMFYFILIVGGVAAVVGTLATYRIIQLRRIPTFVKKAREMKKNIKGKKIISESLLYPSKEEYIVKKLGDKWEMMGLSLDDMIGVKEKKKKKLSKEEFNQFKGGAV